MGHNISCFFFPSCGAFSASFILLLNSSNVSSISSNPSGGGLRLREVRTGGMVGSVFRLTEGTLEIDENRRYRILSNMNTVDLTVWWFLLGLLVGNNTHKSGLSWKVIRGSFFAATHRLLVLREVRTCSDWWIWAKNSNSQFPLFKLRFQTNWALPIPILFEDVDYITFFRSTMDPSQAQLDLSKLSDTDKKELNQFLNNEAQKTNIQQSKWNALLVLYDELSNILSTSAVTPWQMLILVFFFQFIMPFCSIG